MNWAKFLQDQGKAAAQLDQVRQDVKRLEAKLDAIAKGQEEAKVLAASSSGAYKGAYKTIAITATIVTAVATLAARWWVAIHTGG